MITKKINRRKKRFCEHNNMAAIWDYTNKLFGKCMTTVFSLRFDTCCCPLLFFFWLKRVRFSVDMGERFNTRRRHTHKQHKATGSICDGTTTPPVSLCHRRSIQIRTRQHTCNTNAIDEQFGLAKVILSERQRDKRNEECSEGPKKKCARPK